MNVYTKTEVDALVAGVGGDPNNITGDLTVTGDIRVTDASTSFERYVNAVKSNVSLDLTINETASAIRLINGENFANDTNVYFECNNTTANTTMFKPLHCKDTATFTGAVSLENQTLNTPSGSSLYITKAGTGETMRIINDSRKLTFDGTVIHACTNTGTPTHLALNMLNGDVRMNQLGVGGSAGSFKFIVSGGSACFYQGLRSDNPTTLNGNTYVSTKNRIYQRADANNSLNIISEKEINLSLQTDRDADPDNSSIAIQIETTWGITFNKKATANEDLLLLKNLALNSENNTIGEFYTGSGDDMLLTNSVSTQGIRLRIGTTDICEVSSTGLHVTGAVTETSDKQLKENIKEIDSNKCVEMIKYIKPKTYNFIGNDKKCVGYIADDFKTKKMPEEWDNIIFESKDGYLRMDYNKTTPLLWSALQNTLKRIEKLEKEIKALKGSKNNSEGK